jgi:hypothetical protein
LRLSFAISTVHFLTHPAHILALPWTSIQDIFDFFILQHFFICFVQKLSEIVLTVISEFLVTNSFFLFPPVSLVHLPSFSFIPAVKHGKKMLHYSEERLNATRSTC